MTGRWSPVERAPDDSVRQVRGAANCINTWRWFLASIALVVAATFPWTRVDHDHWARVAWVPFLTGIISVGDLVVNVLLYLPLGWFVPGARPRPRLIGALASALVLSAAMETAQVWSHLRYPSATDTAMNLAGAAAGAYWSNRRRRRGHPPVAPGVPPS